MIETWCPEAEGNAMAVLVVPLEYVTMRGLERLVKRLALNQLKLPSSGTEGGKGKNAGCIKQQEKGDRG